MSRLIPLGGICKPNVIVGFACYPAPTSPTRGEGVMKGQMLDPAVKIIKAARVK